MVAGFAAGLASPSGLTGLCKVPSALATSFSLVLLSNVEFFGFGLRLTATAFTFGIFLVLQFTISARFFERSLRLCGVLTRLSRLYPNVLRFALSTVRFLASNRSCRRLNGWFCRCNWGRRCINGRSLNGRYLSRRGSQRCFHNRRFHGDSTAVASCSAFAHALWHRPLDALTILRTANSAFAFGDFGSSMTATAEFCSAAGSSCRCNFGQGITRHERAFFFTSTCTVRVLPSHRL